MSGGRSPDERWQPGETVVLRYITRDGRPGMAWSYHVVEDRDGLIALHIPRGSTYKRWQPAPLAEVAGYSAARRLDDTVWRRDVLRLMGPRILGLAAAQVNFLVIMIFASFVSDAAISATNYAFLMAMLPVGVIGMAISTAVFPTLAQRAAAEELDALRDTLVRALRTILFLAIPASAGLALLAKPAVVMLLQRGAFGGASTELVVQALINMSIVVNLLPTTGIPLPMISYGGSSMLASCIAIGILLNISQPAHT